jgi:hypothetical protein
MSGKVKRTHRGRRLRRKLFWALVILGVLVLAVGGWVVRAVDAAGDAVGRLGRGAVPQPVRRSARTGSP